MERFIWACQQATWLCFRGTGKHVFACCLIAEVFPGIAQVVSSDFCLLQEHIKDSAWEENGGRTR